MNPDNKEGLVLLYEALEEKLIELAFRIKTSNIVLDDKDDKTFDRLMKAMVESKEIAENQLWLKIQLGIAKPEEDKAKNRNPIERRAR